MPLLCTPPPRTPKEWEGRGAASVGLQCPVAAQPRPPPGREAPPKAPAGRGRGRVIFTSLQAAWATGSERAARQMWGAWQLGAASHSWTGGGPQAVGGGVCEGWMLGLGSPFVPRRLASPPRSPFFPTPHSSRWWPRCLPALLQSPRCSRSSRVPSGVKDPSPHPGDLRVPAE